MANSSSTTQRGPSITLLTLPGRGLVGAAITPNGHPLSRRVWKGVGRDLSTPEGQEPGFPLPLGLLQSLGGQVSRVPTEEDAAADALGAAGIASPSCLKV